jgi:hypothetical protein
LLCFFSSLTNTIIRDDLKAAFKDLAETTVVMWEEIRHKRERVLNSMCQSFLGESQFNRTKRQNLADAESGEADDFYRQVRNAVYRSLVVRDKILTRFQYAPNSPAIIDKAVVVIASMFDLKADEIKERRQRRANADVPKRNAAGYMRYEGDPFG